MRRSMRGVAAVEFAIVLIPLLLLGFGITEFGRAIYSYNTLTKSVRDAARYLTTKTPGDVVAHGVAKCLAVYGNAGCSAPALAPGLTTDMVAVTDVSGLPTGTGTINTVTVSINGYPYNSVVEFVMPDLTFGNIAITMRSHL